ncbi:MULTISPECIES: TlpA family protein disulfide reductase [Streptomyces]|uniref:TlpA family protein disulfide reductase n=1 Tax=Streptomyces heilongjiangensis TaxID=945052 RepID=A0ABW1BJH6_9ACTN|nr:MULTISPECIES: TlpA disulfide reductase family protein [Streptomyces]MDC2952656.1 TlpA disulfide reductase family protein [Streptomyces heilongjiangensis]
MKRSIVSIAVAAAVVAVGGGGILAVTSMDGSERTGYRVSDGVLTIDVKSRPDAPDIKGTTVDGKPFRLSDYRGKTVVVNAWAYWCGPCRLEMPMLVDYEKSMKRKGVVVVGINHGSGIAASKAFIEEFDVPYPNLDDPSGKSILDMPKGVIQSQGLPFTFVIDSRHKIAASRSGAINRKMLEEMTSWAVKPSKKTAGR